MYKEVNARMNKVESISHSFVFKQLLKSKHRFILSTALISLSTYFLLPLLIILFPGWMNTAVLGSFTIAWLLAFAQFPFVWIIGLVYFKKAKYFDHLVDHIKQRRKPL